MFNCYYFETESGRKPVAEFVAALDIATQKKFLTKRDLLEEHGPRLYEPHVKYLGHHIFELRFQGRDGNFRIFYFFCSENRIIFTNAFKKETDATPRRELDLAIQRRKLFLSRERW